VNFFGKVHVLLHFWLTYIFGTKAAFAHLETLTFEEAFQSKTTQFSVEIMW
jgi:hypothetical protein